MKIKRQRVIPYILVLLVALAIPQITLADDPCKDFNDAVTKFVSEMPSLSSSELTVGRFDVENNKISYLVNGHKIFKKEWHDSCDPSDEFCKAQITPILGLGGYGGLHIAQQGRHFALTCDHLIFPSSTTNSFKSVSKPRSITVKDLDNDNVSEVISHELQQWALDCDLCLACIDATAWNDIYHLSSEGNLISVNEQFPQRYAELLTQYRKQYDSFKQDTKNYVNACNSQQLNNQFQILINRAEKLAKSAHQSVTPSSALSGNWRGSVYQPGIGTYMAELSLHGTNGTVEYPYLKCGGTVAMLNNSGNVYQYAEHITHGNVASGGGCVNDGVITTKVHGGSMDFKASGQWQGRTYTAKGVLTRSGQVAESTHQPPVSGRANERYPIPGSVSQYFGVPWSENAEKTHTGVDIPAVKGTVVPATAYGRVVLIGDLGGDWGYYVIVEENNGKAKGYLHITPSVSKGVSVNPGDEIGKVYMDHLHYNVCMTKSYCQRGALPTTKKDPKYPNDPLFQDGPFVRP